MVMTGVIHCHCKSGVDVIRAGWIKIDTGAGAAEQTLAQLSGAKIFSKLDANSALASNFYHTRFFNRLPFGITSALLTLMGSDALGA